MTEAAAARRSIAVLPLVNLTGEAANDYLSDGITESLINELSRIENLKVISRSSAFQFKNKDATAQEIGEKPGVKTILEGNLRRSADKIRIEAEILRVQELDPLSFGVRLHLSELYYYWHKPDKAIEQAELMLAAEPNNESVYDFLAKADAQKAILSEHLPRSKKLCRTIRLAL